VIGSTWLLWNTACWISKCTAKSITSWWVLWCCTCSSCQAASCDVWDWWYLDSGSCIRSTEVCRVQSCIKSDAWLPYSWYINSNCNLLACIWSWSLTMFVTVSLFLVYRKTSVKCHIPNKHQVSNKHQGSEARFPVNAGSWINSGSQINAGSQINSGSWSMHTELS